MKIEGKNEAERVQFFYDLYTAVRVYAEEIYANMDKYRRQYRGSREIDGSKVEADHVRNITYELIESQITSYLPNPAVSPKIWSERNERCAKSVERLLAIKRNELPFEEMNDIDERLTPIYGSSAWLCEWDESVMTHSTVGDVKISCFAPKKFTGQPNIYRVDDMEYCFIEFEATKEDIIRKYGVSPEKAEEAERSPNAGTAGDDEDTATIYICYYKDEDDNVCEYIWSGDVELSDIRDYYARKHKVCRKCGKKEALCECEKPEFDLANEEYEELTEDIQCSDGTIIPAMSPVFENGEPVMVEEQRQAVDESGMPIFDEIAGIRIPKMATVQVNKMAPTKLPFYKPKTFPIKIRKNTSDEDSLFGQSDCEFIRPQQMAINKLESRMMQKLLRGGVMPYVPDDATIDLDDGIFDRVMKISEKHVGKYGVLDFQADISRDASAAERHYEHAKQILGITSSFQGQYDSSALSGKAKQMQIQQTQGRLDSKRKMKNALYAELDKTIFQYYLAYADEPRPASYKDAQGRWQNVYFNRYDFIRYDKDTGEYYYDDEFLFAADATVDLESARDFIWQENRQNFQLGAYGNPQLPQTQLIFWQNMERAHYPYARDNVERIQDEIARQAQVAQMQGQIDGLAGEIKTHEAYEEMLKSKIGGAQ